MKKFIFAVLILAVFSIALAADTYKIISVRQNDETLTVTVDYTVGNEVKRVDVPIFAPKTKDDVILGLNNRALTIKAKQEASATAAIVKSDVEKDAGKTANVTISE